MRDVFLITGAAGYLGSKLAIELLARGHVVITALRGKGEAGPAERLEQVLVDRGLEPAAIRAYRDAQRLFAVHYDIEELVDDEGARRRFSEETGALLNRTGPLTEVLHVAADLSMGKGAGRREKSMKRNASGTKVTCRLAIELKAKLFTDVSTWYVCGAGDVERRVRSREELEATKWLNHYQESKAWGEREAEDEAAGKPIKLRVLRPSIVIGDLRHSNTGWNRGELHFLYNSLLRFHLRFNLRHLAKNRRTVFMPPPLHRDQSMNVVPIEMVIGAMLDLAGKDVEGVFHLSDPEPEPLHVFMEHTFRLYYPRENLKVEFGELPPHKLKPVELVRRRVVNDIFGDLSQVIPFATPQFAAGTKRDFAGDGVGPNWRDSFPSPEAIKVRFLVEGLEEEYSPSDRWALLQKTAKNVVTAPAQHRRRTFQRGVDAVLTQPTPEFAKGWKADVSWVLQQPDGDYERQRHYLYFMLANVPEVIEVFAKDPPFSSQWAQIMTKYDDRVFLTGAFSRDPWTARVFAEQTRRLIDFPSSPAIEARRAALRAAFGGATPLNAFLRDLRGVHMDSKPVPKNNEPREVRP